MYKYDPQKHHRRSIRLKGYDYTQPGAYFVTINTQGRVHLFGDVVDGEMVLNAFGRVAATYWQRIPRHVPHVQLGTWVVMPNHIHGIIIITDDGNDDAGRGRAFPNSPTNTSDQGNAAGPRPKTATGECPALPQPQRNDDKGEAFQLPPGNTMVVEEANVFYQERPNTGCPAPTTTNAPSGSLGAIIGNYKSTTTRRINKMRQTPGDHVWQRNYWEHIIRTPESHVRIEDYILNNPARWEADELHPDAPANRFNQEP